MYNMRFNFYPTARAGTLKRPGRLRDGSFLVECMNRRPQAENLLRSRMFVDRPVEVSIHKALNSSARGCACVGGGGGGGIRCRELSDLTEKQICDKLKVFEM